MSKSYTGFLELDEAAYRYVSWVDDSTGREKMVEQMEQEAEWVAMALFELFDRGKYIAGYDNESFASEVVSYALGEASGFLPDDVVKDLVSNVLEDFCRIGREDNWRMTANSEMNGGESE